jgi:sulfur relay protein TusB/DsrH
MPTLHLVNRPHALERCLVAVRTGDRVLCYEHGVLACLGARWQRVAAALDGVEVVALRHDVEAHGLAGRLADEVGIVDDGAFVDLVAASSPVVSWT